MLATQVSNLTADSAVISGTSTLVGPTLISNTTSSVSSVSGALRVNGGVGILGDVHVGGTIYGNISGGGSGFDVSLPYHFTNATASTSTSTGALITDGGMGIKGNLYIGSGTASTTTSTGSVVVNGGAGISGRVSANSVNLNGGIASTSTSLGTLVVTGGTGISGDLRVGGTIYGTVSGGSGIDLTQAYHFTNTTASTSTSTGALITDGGLGVKGDIYATNIFANPFTVTTLTNPSTLYLGLYTSTSTATAVTGLTIVGTFKIARCGAFRIMHIPAMSFTIPGSGSVSSPMTPAGFIPVQDTPTTFSDLYEGPFMMNMVNDAGPTAGSVIPMFSKTGSGGVTDPFLVGPGGALMFYYGTDSTTTWTAGSNRSIRGGYISWYVFD